MSHLLTDVVAGKVQLKHFDLLMQLHKTNPKSDCDTKQQILDDNTLKDSVSGGFERSRAKAVNFCQRVAGRSGEADRVRWVEASTSFGSGKVCCACVVRCDLWAIASEGEGVEGRSLKLVEFDLESAIAFLKSGEPVIPVW